MWFRFCILKLWISMKVINSIIFIFVFRMQVHYQGKVVDLHTVKCWLSLIVFPSLVNCKGHMVISYKDIILTCLPLMLSFILCSLDQIRPLLSYFIIDFRSKKLDLPATSPGENELNLILEFASFNFLSVSNKSFRREIVVFVIIQNSFSI